MSTGIKSTSSRRRTSASIMLRVFSALPLPSSIRVSQLGMASTIACCSCGSVCRLKPGDSTKVGALMRASIDSGQVTLSTAADETADATVSGTPLSLLSLIGSDARVRLRSSPVTINGDAEIAEGFQELLRAARPELEEELSRHMGDVAAHQVVNVMRGVTGWGRNAAATFAANVGEYLQEEGRDLVTRTEMDEFLREVDEQREAADRLEARLARLVRPAKR